MISRRYCGIECIIVAFVEVLIATSLSVGLVVSRRKRGQSEVKLILPTGGTIFNFGASTFLAVMLYGGEQCGLGIGQALDSIYLHRRLWAAGSVS